MANAVTVRTLVDTPYLTVVHCTNISDGSGEETNAIKADKSALVFCPGIVTAGVMAAPLEAVALDIGAVRWNIQGFSSVQLKWDHTTDDVALVLSGGGYDDFIGPGGERGPFLMPTLTDPRSAGGTGDILLTTVGSSATSTYDITLWLRKAAA